MSAHPIDPPDPARDAVTVLIPAYRPDERFTRALASLAAQDHPSVRVVVSLDHAPDHRRPPLPPIEHLQVHEQAARLGWVGNVNWLLSQIRTPYFMVLAHDDALSPTFLSRAVSALQGDPLAVVAHGQTCHEGVREGEVAATDSIRGSPVERVLEFLRRGPHLAEMAWRGVARASLVDRGLHLRTRRSDGQFSNTLWVLEQLLHGDSLAVPDIEYRKVTNPDLGLSRDFHRRDPAQRRLMLADNLACVVDVLRSAGVGEPERSRILAGYAQWMLGLGGPWRIAGPAAGPLPPELRQGLPALADFIAQALLSLEAVTPRAEEGDAHGCARAAGAASPES